jgi:purine-binding chemotaxis protein CheW
MSVTKQFSTFYLQNLMFGIESQNIQEVLRTVELTEVPLAPKAIAGLMNLRGQIVAALDLRQRLELHDRGKDQSPTGVVIRTADGLVGLLVDGIGDVIDVDESTFEACPETLAPRMRSVIVGVHKLEESLMHVLDTSNVCCFKGLQDAKA